MRRDKIKFFILIILIFVFVWLFLNCFKDESLSVIPDNLVYNDKLVIGVYVDDVLCSHDNNSNIYYSNFNDINGISFYSNYNNLKYKVTNIIDNLYEVYVYNDKYYYKLDLVISDIPIINIHDLDIDKYDKLNYFNHDGFIDILTDSGENLKTERKVGISISNVLQNNGKTSFSSYGYMTERGASSSFFDKKSYKLKMNNHFGMYNIKDDNIWILDALYTDSSKVRNKLSSDLWNLINNNQKINNDLGCIFVEVFINDEYVGLYTLKEKVDKSVTRNSDSGLLLKATMHLMDDRIANFLDNPNILSKGMILNFEIKDYNGETYDRFIDNMYSFYSGSRDYESIFNTYYIDNYIDYKILVALISGEDNVTSNQYHSMIDEKSKILITPWDMDLTWGLYWNLDTPLHSEFSYEKDFDYSWMDNNITKNFDEKTFSLMKKRYWQLRKDAITIETIDSYLDSYEKILIESGSTKRDSERWYEYDVEFEIEQIREWARRRIDFLDEYFK